MRVRRRREGAEGVSHGVEREAGGGDEGKELYLVKLYAGRKG